MNEEKFALTIYENDSYDTLYFPSQEEAEDYALEIINEDITSLRGHVSDKDYREHRFDGENAKENLHYEGECTFYGKTYTIEET